VEGLPERGLTYPAQSTNLLAMTKRTWNLINDFLTLFISFLFTVAIGAPILVLFVL
jgi:hypothetical protein